MLVLLLFLFTNVVVCDCSTQATLDYIGTFMDIRLDPVDNTNKDTEKYVPLVLTLRNTGDSTINSGDWKLYFNIMYGAKMEDVQCNMHVGHVNGLLYYLKPLQNFTLTVNRSIACILRMRLHGSAKSDFMPNWYIASSSKSTSPRVIQSTASEELDHVGLFDSPNKWKTDERDTFNPFSTEEIYRRNENPVEEKNHFRIIPFPLEISELGGFVTIDNLWRIKRNEVFPKPSQALSKQLNLTLITTVDKVEKVIEFEIKNDAVFKSNKEAYTIEVKNTPERVTITIVSEVGAFYAVQTLVQMLTINSKSERTLPVLTISDRPRYHHRGLMIDLARNYHGDSIKPIIDVMGRYKLNKLHLHVTDDEGWRLEIPSIPELTDIGSKRCHDQSSPSPCLIPSHGSGPFQNTSGTGYLSVKKFRDILQHAVNNHVTVILEIDMPGHSRAAWRSVNSHSGYTNSTGRLDYRVDNLGDLEDEVEQRWRRSSLNPCLESTYTFIDMVLRDIIEMYRGIQELKQLHIGGDEVVFAEWMKSNACQSNYPNSTMSMLNKMFIRKTLRLLEKYAIAPIIWEDGLYEHDKTTPISDFLPGNITAQTWFNVWEYGRGARPVELANLGYDIIMSPAPHLYLDHAQEPNPDDWGLYWATRFSDTYKVFSFNAHDIYKNIDTTRFGESMSRADVCGQFQCPKLEIKINIKGIEACLWSETVRTERRLHSMLFPRLLAVAERAWHEASWESVENVTKRDLARKEDWNSFRISVGNKHFQQLPFYRVPLPGAILKGRQLRVNVLYTNHIVEMSIDCGFRWSVIGETVDIPVTASKVCLRSRPHDRLIYSRPIEMTVKKDPTLGSKDESNPSSATTSFGTFCLWIYVYIACAIYQMQ